MLRLEGFGGEGKRRKFSLVFGDAFLSCAYKYVGQPSCLPCILLLVTLLVTDPTSREVLHLGALSGSSDDGEYFESWSKAT